MSIHPSTDCSPLFAARLLIQSAASSKAPVIAPDVIGSIRGPVSLRRMRTQRPSC